MLVLIVSHRFYGQSHGGTEVLANDTAVALLAKGHSVIWLAVGPDGEAMEDGPTRRVRADGVEEWQAPAAFSAQYPIAWRDDEASQTRNIEACFRAFLGARTIDAAHLFHFARIGLAFLDLPELADIRCVATLTDYTAVCADFQLYDRRRKGICSGRVPATECVACVSDSSVAPEDAESSARDIQAWRERNAEVFNRRVEAIFVQTPHQRKLLRSLGLRCARFVDDAAAYEVPENWLAIQRSEHRGFVFGFIGRASCEKGVDVAVQAFERVKRRAPLADVSLRIVTNDPAAARKNYCDAGTPSTWIDWDEPVPFERIGALLREIDCLLVPSIWLENHPTILTYALSLDVPVICSDAPSMMHLAGEPLLTFARTGDVDDWARKMRKALARPVTAIGEAQKASLPAFSALVEKMEQQYREFACEPH